MKRNQRTPQSTGCPDCHKTATKTAEAAAGAIVVQTEYVCNTPDCKVDRFTITRVAAH
jgi:hypothetical protein